MKLRLVLLAITIGCCKPAFSANLLDVFDQALQNDPVIAAAKAKLDIVKQNYPQAVSQWLPKINVQGRYGKVTQQLQGGALVQPDELGPYQYDDIWYELNLTQPLFNIPAFHDIRVADAEALAATAEYRYEQQQLIFRVTDAYLSTLAQSDRLKLASEKRSVYEDILQKAQALVRSGKAPSSDVQTVEAAKDLAVVAEVQAENQLIYRREVLRQLAGKEVTDMRRLIANTPLSPPTPTNMEAWTNTALQQNLKLVSLKMRVDAAQRQVSRYRSEHLPQIDLRASYGRYTDGSFFGTQSLDQRVAVDFKMPLFAGGTTSSRVKQGNSNVELAKAEYQKAENEVLIATRDAYLSVLSGMSNVRAMNHALNSSQNALNATIRDYDRGQRPIAELTDAIESFFDTRGRYEQIRYDFIINTMRLRTLVGQATVDDLVMVNNWLDSSTLN
ncbi:MAG: TolC family outer membrane protein [Gammaproteobacteria bacterium]|nr:TolC family outer membrane protein [Gammaproteobacteria bacterium]